MAKYRHNPGAQAPYGPRASNTWTMPTLRETAAYLEQKFGRPYSHEAVRKAEERAKEKIRAALIRSQER